MAQLEGPGATAPVRLLLWTDYQRVADLTSVLIQLKPLLARGAVELWCHCDPARDLHSAASFVDEARRQAEVTGEVTPVDARARPVGWFDACWSIGWGTRLAARPLGAKLGLVAVSDRWRVEELCVDKGVLPAVVEKAFCPLPWLHLHLEADGFATPCCYALPGEGPSLADHSLEAVYNGPGMRRVRLKMLRGVRDEICRGCWNDEDAGATSFRERSLANVTAEIRGLKGRGLGGGGAAAVAVAVAVVEGPERSGDGSSVAALVAGARAVTRDDGSIPAAAIAPLSVDVRWSNLCNFKCRMCYHRASSAWFDDSVKIDEMLGVAGTRRSLLHGSKAILSFNDDGGADGGAAIDKIAPYLGQLRTVYSAGGEPLMMDEHFEFLDRLRARGPDIWLGYNTNLSRLDHRGRDLLDIWRPFRHVHLNVSVDGVGAVGEYVRTGFRTERFIENLLAIREAARGRPGLSYELQITISTYNLFHVPALVREALARQYIGGPDQLSFNFVRSPVHASAGTLPRALRERAACEYEALIADLDRDYPGQGRTRQLRDAVISPLRSGDDGVFELHRGEVWQWMNMLDRLRGTSWRDVAPHMACYEPQAGSPSSLAE